MGVLKVRTGGAWVPIGHVNAADLAAETAARVAGDAALTPTVWTAFPFAANWSNVGGSNMVAEYRKAGDTVEIHGLVKSTAGLGTIGTLPVGFRPTRGNLWFATHATGAYGEFYVASNGTVGANVGNVASSFSINCEFSIT